MTRARGTFVAAGAVVAVAVVALAVWLVFGGSSGGGERAPSPRASVTASGLAFAPVVLRVPVGGVGEFKNEDSVAHTFTADGGLFDSGSVAPGAQFSFSFGAAGEVTYHCEIHPSMKGRVVVEGEG